MTDEVDAKGYFILRKHALVSFRFDGVHDSEMDSFASRNILFGMDFLPDSDSSSLRVVVDSVMDMSGSFSAGMGEVVSIIPCTSDGKEVNKSLRATGDGVSNSASRFTLVFSGPELWTLGGFTPRA